MREIICAFMRFIMDDVSAALNSSDIIETEGDRIVAIKRFQGRFSGYPIKVVYEKQGEDTSVITAYPLKKKYRR